MARSQSPLTEENNMKIHEFQAKPLLQQFGVAIPKGIKATTPDEVVAAFESLGGPWAVVKSQIHAGGRGEGRFSEHRDQAGDGVRKKLGRMPSECWAARW